MIDQAKAEFAKKKNPVATSTDDGTLLKIAAIDCQSLNGIESYRRILLDTLKLTYDAVITDASDPNFDLEKLLLKVAKENP